MASSDSQINKPQHGRPKRAELLDVNINTGAQALINTESILNNLCDPTCYVRWNRKCASK